MGQMLINVIMYLLNAIASLLLSPVMKIIVTVIPATAAFLTNIIEFISLMLTYASWCCKVLMIPSALPIAVLGLSLTMFTVSISIRTIGLALAIYKSFKP